MTIAIVQSATNNEFGTNIIVTLGSTPIDGNLMVGYVAKDDGNQSIGTPTGWTGLFDNNRAAGLRSWMGYRFASSDDTTIQWDTDNESMAAGVMEFSGVDAIEGVGTRDPDFTGPHTISTPTPSEDNMLIVYGICWDTGCDTSLDTVDSNITLPTNNTDCRFSGSGGAGFAMGYEIQTTATQRDLSTTTSPATVTTDNYVALFTAAVAGGVSNDTYYKFFLSGDI